MAINAFYQLKSFIDSLACPDCRGLGEHDDADPNDMVCNTWECPSCKGMGLKPEKYEIAKWLQS